MSFNLSLFSVILFALKMAHALSREEFPDSEPKTMTGVPNATWYLAPMDVVWVQLLACWMLKRQNPTQSPHRVAAPSCKGVISCMQH